MNVEDVVPNFKKPAISLKFYKLKPYGNGESAFKSECPVCDDGILMCCRNNETGELLQHDRCVVCGQEVIYEDIEALRRLHGRAMAT